MERVESSILCIQSMKPHFHDEELEIILVLKGNVDVCKIERVIHLKEGEFTFINRGVTHYLLSDNKACVLSTKIKLSQFKDVFSRIEYVEFLSNDEHCEKERLLKDRMNAIVIDCVIRNYQCQGYKHLIEEKRFNEAQLVYMLFSSYQLISHWKDEEEYLDQELQERYYYIVEYILKNMDKKIVAEDILKHIYMNPTYFSQFMKKVSGVGFKEFVSYRKLIRAISLLVDTSMSMVDVANTVGIFDMKSFYHVFKKYFHDSPAKWRERILLIEDNYYVYNEHSVLDDFMRKYHIYKHRENTVTKLYKYLLSCQLYSLDWQGMEIVLNPYKDMGASLDDDYQVYKYFGAFIAFLKQKNIQLILLYPFKYLKIELHRKLLLDTLRVNILQLGTNEIKKWKIVFQISCIEDFEKALLLKKEIFEEFGLCHIEIVLDTSSNS